MNWAVEGNCELESIDSASKFEDSVMQAVIFCPASQKLSWSQNMHQHIHTTTEQFTVRWDNKKKIGKAWREFWVSDKIVDQTSYIK